MSIAGTSGERVKLAGKGKKPRTARGQKAVIAQPSGEPVTLAGEGKGPRTARRQTAGIGDLPGEPVQLASEGKEPRTARGQKTLRKILDAALGEFGEKGFGESSIVGITTRAHVALGTFYTYFDSKEAVFAALVGDMSGRVRDHVAPAIVDARDGLDGEQLALEAYLGFVKDHKEVYRIIDEAEFVDPAGFRAHYETTASRIAGRLEAAAERGEISGGDALTTEVRAWAIMGMNVFLGLRFGVWGDEPPGAVAAEVNRLLRRGLEG